MYRKYGRALIIILQPPNLNCTCLGGWCQGPARGYQAAHNAQMPVQLTFNAVITAARQRVEAAVGEINDNHRLFQLAWQGELAPLRDAVHVTVHTTQLAIEMGSVNATPEDGYSRYADVCGPWRHDEPRH